MSFIVIQKYGFQVQSLYSSNVSQHLIHLLNNKQAHPTKPTILLSFIKTDSLIQFKTIKTAQEEIQKVFSRNSSYEVDTVTRKGRGFADIKIKGKKCLAQLYTSCVS